MNLFKFAVNNARREFQDRVIFDAMKSITKLRVVCAWCPTFDPTKQEPGASHGMCLACAARLHAEMDLHGGEW